MKAIGITCGIGSMLVGARAAGFEIVGNVEWRKYYHHEDDQGRNTFRENFPGASFFHKVEDMPEEELEKFMGADLALGHPECGNFSQLGGVNKGRLEKLQDASDIPLFVDLVAKLRPRFFVMDDLPKSFGAFPMSEYVRRLPDYDLFPEWVSNWGYGNVQKHRNRMFMIGALKEERFVFIPDEREQEGLTLESVIGDVGMPRRGGNYPNHDPCAWNEPAQKNLSMREIGDRPTWAEVGSFAKENWPEGASMTYHANDGTMKKKPGCKVERWDGPASVQDGGSYKIHPRQFRPLTLRERALIQGFPDDFIFYGTRLNDLGEYNPDKNVVMAKQTGKAMPVQFCTYVSHLIAGHIQGLDPDHDFEGGEISAPSEERILRANPDVDRAKQDFCETRGYADQEAACHFCWLYDQCSIRQRKYRIGEPAVGQRDLVDPGVVESPAAPPQETRERVRVKAPTRRVVKKRSRSSRFQDAPERGEIIKF